MKSGVTTWQELERIGGEALVVVNSEREDERAAAALFDELTLHVSPHAVYVIASSAWQPWLVARGLSPDRLLPCADAEGRDLELNHFLESPPAVLWMLTKRFEVIVGSAPHNMYNEEIKDIFERRACLVVRDGYFLAHTLPQPFVTVLDLPSVLGRFTRREKVEAYKATSREIVDDLFQIWVKHGRPQACDSRHFTDVVNALGTQLGTEVLDFDEVSPIPIEQPDDHQPVVEQALLVADVLRKHDQRLAEADQQRVNAVKLRDAIIDDLRRQLNTPVRRVLRWLAWS